MQSAVIMVIVKWNCFQMEDGEEWNQILKDGFGVTLLLQSRTNCIYSVRLLKFDILFIDIYIGVATNYIIYSLFRMFIISIRF